MQFDEARIVDELFELFGAMSGRPWFTNFDLRLVKVKEGRYAVSVQHSPAGETPEQDSTIINIPYNDEPMRGWLQGLAEGFTSGEVLRSLGLQLTGYLLPSGKVRDLYHQSLGIATAQGGGLRIRLRIAAPELALLPWEYAYDESIADFFVLNPRTMLVRYHSVPTPPLPISSLTPVPVLAVLSNPPNTTVLTMSETFGSLLRSLSSMLERKQILLDVLFAGSPRDREAIDALAHGCTGIQLLSEVATIDALRNALRQPYRIMHYVGHGGFHESAGGGLFLAGDRGRAALVKSALLAQELRASSVAVVVLNACHSATESSTRAFAGLAPGLIHAGVPAVIAMQYAIREDSAARFSAALYGALADGWPLDAAVTEGRKAVRAALTEDAMDWGIPVLFMRSPDGVIWKMKQTESARMEHPPIKNAESAVQPSITTIGGPGAHVEITGDFVLGSKTQITDSVVHFGGHVPPPTHGADRQRLIVLLNELRQELARAVSASSLNERDALAARSLVGEALREAGKSVLDQQQITEHLRRADDLVRAGKPDADATANLARLFASIAEIVLRAS